MVLATPTDGCIVSSSPLLPAAVDVVSAAASACATANISVAGLVLGSCRFVFGFCAGSSCVSEASVNNQVTLCDFKVFHPVRRVVPMGVKFGMID